MMKIAVLGINHKRCSAEMREMVAINKTQLPLQLKAIKSMVNEVVILSTCNRTEIYVALNDEASIRERLISIWNGKADILRDNFYFCSGVNTARHLFSVACGLDSMITGENEILGQVRDAYKIAVEEEATGKTLNRLFHNSFRIGKRVRRETRIANGLSSAASVACKLAEDILGNLETRRIMLMGVGKIGETMIGYLKKRGVTNLVIVNRTHEKACELAQQFGVEAVRFEGCLEEMVNADMVITSASAPHYLLKREDVERVMAKRGLPLNGSMSGIGNSEILPIAPSSPLLLIDLGLPRNIAPDVGDLPGVSLYNLDHLEQVVRDNLSAREDDVQQAKAIIEEEVGKFQIEQYGLGIAECGMKEVHNPISKIRKGGVRRCLHNKEKLCHPCCQ